MSAPMEAAVPTPTRGPTCFHELPGHMSTLAASAAAYRPRGACCSTCSQQSGMCLSQGGRSDSTVWRDDAWHAALQRCVTLAPTRVPIADHVCAGTSPP